MSEGVDVVDCAAAGGDRRRPALNATSARYVRRTPRAGGEARGTLASIDEAWGTHASGSWADSPAETGQSGRNGRRGATHRERRLFRDAHVAARVLRGSRILRDNRREPSGYVTPATYGNGCDVFRTSRRDRTLSATG